LEGSLKKKEEKKKIMISFFFWLLLFFVRSESVKGKELSLQLYGEAFQAI
jgi:hypothetical protein